jgi:large repetitive protein
VGDFERRLLEVERRLGHAGLGLERTRLRTLQGLQEVRQLWSDLATVTSACSLAATILYGGAPVTTGTVTVAGPGGFSASGTPDASGVFATTIPGSGSYTVSYSGSCSLAGSTTVSATCPGPNAVTLTPTTTAGGKVNFSIRGCATLAPPNATVTVSGGGATYTGTTTTGGLLLDVSPTGAGSYSWTVTEPTGRFVTASGTVTVACNATAGVTVNLTAAAGYVCITGCDLPVATTVTLTTPQGGVTLTYAAGVWTGTQARSVATRAKTTTHVRTGCPTAGTCDSATSDFAGGTCTISWAWNGSNVSGSYTTCDDGTGTRHPVDDSVAAGLHNNCLSQNIITTRTNSGCPGANLYAGTATSTPIGLSSAALSVDE